MIPNIIHFVFGLRPDAFHLYQYIAVASAVRHNRPDETVIHYAIEPSGEWWPRLSKLPSVRFNRIDAPTEIYGNPLLCYAHQSDVVRLQVLQQYGGIYLDIDTLTLRDLSPLREHEFVMAWQGTWGLCNAVMLSEPHSDFATRWMEEYRYFRGTGPGRAYWDEHSVQLPAKLARLPDIESHVTILDDHAFFYPLWPHISALFRNSCFPGMKATWVVHLWETAARNTLSQVTPEWIRASRSFYAIHAREVL